MDEQPSRREELIAAALSGDLDADEQQAFETAAEVDPTMLTELAELQEVTGRLSAAHISWREEAPSPGLAERVMAVTGGRTGSDELTGRRAARHGLARTWVIGIAVAAAALGAVGALGIRSLVNLPPAGPPGTLGALEHVQFEPSPLAGDVDASLVAHTWGTETVLEVDGFPAGQVYEVVLIDTGNRKVGSGAFVGAAGVVDCRMTAGLLRRDVRGVQIQDASGSVLLTAQVPAT